MSNKMMSREDLVHLLENSIENCLPRKQSMKEIKDKPIKQVMKSTRKFIQNQSTEVDEEMNVPTKREAKFYK